MMTLTPQSGDRLPERPAVIFLDAVGTLFGVKGTVGEIYAQLARPFGVETDPVALNRAFFQSFRAAPPLGFPGLSASEIPRQEYEWWERVALDTFQRAGAIHQFSSFFDYFAELYDHFATAEPWFVYPDVYEALRTWRAQGIPLGILSNFDSRIHQVLPALGLAEFFTSITISTDVGAAKPDPIVFQAALAKHQCRAEQAWHIGDSLKEDYEGAKAAGLRAIWLHRSD